MSFAKTTGDIFDLYTPLLSTTFQSQYINLGYWDETTHTIKEAQQKVVDLFARFSKLYKGLKVIDVGCGTGEQDLYFLDHYQCQHITGINISSSQIKIAQSKIKNKKKYMNHITFEVEDALNLKKRIPATYDRVLTLECAQYLPKKKFIEGAYHVLKPGGYLCIVDPIFNFPYEINEKKFPNLIHRIEDEKIKDEYGSVIENKMSFYLKVFAEPLRDSLKEVHISYDELLDFLKEEGFEVEQTQEITKHVIPFYPAVEKEVFKILKNSKIDSYQLDLYLTFLTLAYLNYSAYLAGLAKFYFIRALKH